MTWRTIGLIAATVVISVAVLHVILSDDSTTSKSTDLILPASEKLPKSYVGTSGSGPIVNVASQPTPKRTGSDALESGSTDDMDSEYAEDDENLKNRNLENYLIHDSSLDATRLDELKDYDSFNELMSQLREQTGSTAEEKRMSYELLFYSQPTVREGSVALDALECGTSLCASELRANDQATLDQFIKSLTGASEFEAGAVIQLRGFPNHGAGDSELRRIIFPHDPTIRGIRVSRSTLFPEN